MNMAYKCTTRFGYWPFYPRKSWHDCVPYIIMYNRLKVQFSFILEKKYKNINGQMVVFDLLHYAREVINLKSVCTEKLPFYLIS